MSQTQGQFGWYYTSILQSYTPINCQRFLDHCFVHRMYFILILTIVLRDISEMSLLHGSRTLFLTARRLLLGGLVFTYRAEDKVISPLPILNNTL